MSGDEGWGFADMYGMDEVEDAAPSDISDVESEDWRNILVLGRATGRTIYPETLSLVGHAKYLADGLGCRVEVLLIGEDLEDAVKILEKYPVDNVYTVQAPDYAPIDHTAKILYEVVRKRRPELVLVFQSRTGDAICSYAAHKLGAGFTLGAKRVEIDTMKRRTTVTHQGKNPKLQVLTEFLHAPAFVSVQRGLFRVPVEDPYGTTKLHPVEIDAGELADIQVKGRDPPPAATLATAERVVVAGARVRNKQDLAASRALAVKMDAVFVVTRAVVDRGLAGDDDVVLGARERMFAKAAKVIVGIGCTGSLNTLEAFSEDATIVAVSSGSSDPINKRATYRIDGAVADSVAAIAAAL
jgi:electron transfer flavoprotein alpha subunit